ncbi:MAG: hypothetical protein R3E77_10630 [Steroidobacteraceae bacterium]
MEIPVFKGQPPRWLLLLLGVLMVGLGAFAGAVAGFVLGFLFLAGHKSDFGALDLGLLLAAVCVVLGVAWGIRWAIRLYRTGDATTAVGRPRAPD